MRVITFSRYFPAKHPRKGDETNLVEKVWAGLTEDFSKTIEGLGIELLNFTRHEYKPKYHTIRANNRWKVGNKFSPRVWSGKPYRSKQIEFAPPIEIKKIWDFTKDLLSDNWYLNGVQMSSKQRIDLAINDGLLYKDMLAWFNKPFNGQILCWNEKINY